MPKSLRAPLFLTTITFCLLAAPDPSRCQSPPQSTKPAAPAVIAAPAAPQSTHYPILLLAFGANPSWSLRIGQKGPERLDRANYPPIPVDPGEITREGATDAWTYHAKDSATGADISVRLTRESCTDPTSQTKYTFRAMVTHGQIGALNGCARIAAELFPKINNQAADDAEDAKPKPVPPTVTNFKSPVAVAYVNSARKVIFSHGAIKKIAAPEGSELCVSHDGRKLLYTRSDSTTGPERTIMLYDFVTSRSTELQHGLVRQAFWSPDDSRIAFVKMDGQNWKIWTFPIATPENASPFSTVSVNSLHGWTDAHTVLASDLQSAYWIGDDGKPTQTLALKDLYGDAFDVMSSDTIRPNPLSADLLLVSANYLHAPPTIPTDAMSLASGFFLYEVRAKRRVVLSPPDQWARAAEWSRDGLQVFYTRRLSATSSLTFRIFWDGTATRRYSDGTEFVVGE